MKVAVAIATAGRTIELSETMGFLRIQTRIPDAVFICPASEGDLDPQCLVEYPCPTNVIWGGKGLTVQRNVIVDRLSDEDLVLFIDDDFLPAPDYLDELERLFASRPDLVVATGDVVVDGANGPGIPFDDASKTLLGLPHQSEVAPSDIGGAYGCNMAVRVSTLKGSRVMFDENLPLYGWWEDIDFSRRMLPYGRVMRSGRLRGIHRGTKHGRSSGKRVGYSQVANILYLMKKGSVTPTMALNRIAKNVCANLLKQLYPEPWIDRRGRFQGNLQAAKDALRGRIDPGRILNFD